MQDYFIIFQGKTLAVVLTIALILFSQLLRVLIVKYIKKTKQEDDENYKHIINMARNFINVITLILVFVLWSSEIQEFAISIAAFTVAIVIATKELLQSFLGFIYLTSARIFKVGDWIQVGDDMGEVIDITWSKVSMLEIDSRNYGFTGKTIFVSNSLLLTLTIKNLNFMKRYVHYSFKITQEDAGINPYTIRDEIIQRIKVHCTEFETIGERYNSLIQNKLGIKFIHNEPHVDIGTTNLGKMEFNISLFCPTDKVQELEDKITSDVFDLWYEEIKKKK